MFHSWQYAVTVVILARSKHILTNLFWFCLTKKCAASFSCLFFSCPSAKFSFCSSVPFSVSYALLLIHPSCLHAVSIPLSEESLKHQFPQIILVPSQKCLPVCFAVQGCVNSELCVLSFLRAITVPSVFDSSTTLLTLPILLFRTSFCLVSYMFSQFLTIFSHVA